MSSPAAQDRRPTAAEATGSRRARPRAALVLGGGLLGIALLALGARRELGPVVVREEGAGTRVAQPWPDRPTPTTPAPSPGEQPPPPPPLPEDTLFSLNAILIAAAVLLAVLVLGVILWTLRRARRLRPPERERAERADGELLAVQEAQDALALAAERLSYGPTPGDAVIDAWLALETRFLEAGVRRSPQETVGEFVPRVLGRLDVRPEDLEVLAVLYRRALFDDAPLQEADRDSARRALAALADRLRPAREPGTAPGSAPASARASGPGSAASGERPPEQGAPL